MRDWETVYYANKDNAKLILFPYLFSRPENGAKILNTSTNEVYTIKQSFINPYNKRWEGLIELNCTTPPSENLDERLRFIDETKYIRFTKEYPRAQLTNGETLDNQIVDPGPIVPTVVYTLIRKEPGSISKDPFGPAKQYRPTLRQKIQITNSSDSYEIWGQPFDHLVQFDCWTTDNYSADLLASWMECFLEKNTEVLKLNGVQELLYWQRLADKAVTKWRQDLISRTVQYFIRTESLQIKDRKNLIHIEYNFNVTQQIDKSLDRWIANQHITGNIDYVQYKSLFVNSSGNYMFGDFNLNHN
jgi:hypothetical protein